MKCAVSDFDRTLYVDGRISPDNLAAVRRWQAAGHWFVIATGRNDSSLRPFLEEYGLRPDALILNNGALILDGEGRELFCRTIEPETAKEVLHFLDGIDDDGSGVSMRSRKVNVLSRSGTTTQKPCDGDLEIGAAGSLSEIVQIHRRNLDEGAITALCAVLNASFPKISAYANVWNADVVAKGVNKSAAIAWLADYHGGFGEIRVIGDSANDIEMIADYQGAALSAARSEIKTIASIVVEDVAQYLNGVLEETLIMDNIPSDD